MDAFLALPRDRRAELIERAADELGISPAAIEKDFWVCWAMREMLRSVEGPHLTLKGGTSLSKCWNLIQRFSEDIDLVVDREHLGFGPENAPETAPSRNEEGRRADAVLERCKRHVHDVLLPTRATPSVIACATRLPSSSNSIQTPRISRPSSFATSRCSRARAMSGLW